MTGDRSGRDVAEYGWTEMLRPLALTDQQRQAAALIVADHARDAADLRGLLHAVGLLEDPACLCPIGRPAGTSRRQRAQECHS